MPQKDDISRRVFLGTTVAASSLLAGCSGGGTESSSPTGTPSDTETPAPTETATATATETEKPTTVETFAYPSGATRDGINPTELFSTHRTSIVDGGSATVAVEGATERGDYTTSTQLRNSYADAGILRVDTANSLTERLWSPADEEVGYVEMDTGFEQRYRIDNQAPGPQPVLRLAEIDSLLAGGEWSEAMAVAEHPSGEGVVYETTGIASEQELLRAFPGESVSSFTASATVTASGYLHELTYEITVAQREQTMQQQATITTEEVGTTSLSVPSWASTAKEEGVRFDVGVTDDSKAIKLDLVNGTVPSGARVSLFSGKNGNGSLSQSLSAGDSLYASLSADNELLLGVNEVPSSSTELTDFVYVSIRDGQFPLVDQSIRV